EGRVWSPQTSATWRAGLGQESFRGQNCSHRLMPDGTPQPELWRRRQRLFRADLMKIPVLPLAAPYPPLPSQKHLRSRVNGFDLPAHEEGFWGIVAPVILEKRQ